MNHDDAPRPCPSCGAPWERTEIEGAARSGGGYRLLCHECGHRWDDMHTSYGQRHTARRFDPPTPAPEPLAEADPWEHLGHVVSCLASPCESCDAALAALDAHDAEADDHTEHIHIAPTVEPDAVAALGSYLTASEEP